MRPSITCSERKLRGPNDRNRHSELTRLVFELLFPLRLSCGCGRMGFIAIEEARGARLREVWLR